MVVSPKPENRSCVSGTGVSPEEFSTVVAVYNHGSCHVVAPDGSWNPRDEEESDDDSSCCCSPVCLFFSLSFFGCFFLLLTVAAVAVWCVFAPKKKPGKEDTLHSVLSSPAAIPTHLEDTLGLPRGTAARGAVRGAGARTATAIEDDGEHGAQGLSPAPTALFSAGEEHGAQRLSPAPTALLSVGE